MDPMIIPYVLLSVLLAFALFLTIRNWIKGTLWSNNTSSALGGAVIGVVLVLLITLYFFLTLEGAILLIVGYGAFFGIPIFAIVGAIIFGIIGSTKRKNASVIDHKSSPTTSPSINYESLLIKSNESLTSKSTIMDKPIIVWILTILVVIKIIRASATYPGNIILYYTPPDVTMDIPFSMLYYIIIASIISQIVFITLFFKLKRSSLKWLYISIGLEIVINLISLLHFGLYQNLIGLAITAIVGWLIWDYISNRTVEGKRIFN